MLILENLGQLVLKKRASQGIRAAAKEIGISHATLSRIENGHLPDVENYKKICNWLDVDITPSAAHQTSSPIPQVHFRKESTVSPETAQALAQLILTAQTMMLSRKRRDYE